MFLSAAAVLQSGKGSCYIPFHSPRDPQSLHRCQGDRTLEVRKPDENHENIQLSRYAVCDGCRHIYGGAECFYIRLGQAGERC